MKIVVTIVGKDQVGIIAMAANLLAEHNVNILSVNQNVMDGLFNMVMMAETLGADDDLPLGDLQRLLREKGDKMNLDIKVQRQDIFNAMHVV